LNKSYPKGREIAALLPSIELLEKSRQITEKAILDIGRLTIETVLNMSAEDAAGPPQRGKRKGDIRHHGSQPGNVKVGGKRVQVDRPRLRTRSGQEAPLAAYELLKTDPKRADRALSRVLAGVSTRDYAGIFDEAGEEVGVSRSNVSRESAKAAEGALKELTERRIEARQLAILIDGTNVGEVVAVTAVGIDESGTKRVLGLAEGASENAASVGSLLDSVIERGVDPLLPTLFVIDGSKALKKAIKDRFSGAVIQRCQIHKVRNVIGHLPLAVRDLYDKKLNLAFKLPYGEALDRLELIAKELEVLHPGAANSLREGMPETLTVKRLNLPPLLVSSLRSTNLIESSFTRAKTRLRRFSNFSSGGMSLKWSAAALKLAEQGFRRVKGVKDLWMLKASLDQPLEVLAK
jgi:putative transposase